MKILFFGSSEYCLSILEVLYKKYNIEAIITCPDKKVGRKQILTSSLPKQFAVSHNIKVYTPKGRLGLLSLQGTLSPIQSDLTIVVDYGLIIPREIFTLPRYKTLNIHFSKLPQFRGPSPIQYTILFGKKSAWITVFILEDKMDTGDIIWQKEVQLAGNETTGTLKQKLFNIIAMELPDIISSYINNKLKPQKQNHSQTIYTRLFTRKDGFIPSQLLDMAMKGIKSTTEQLDQWPLSKHLASQLTINNYQLTIERAVRAFSPWPGVWTEIDLKHLGRFPTESGSPEVKRSELRVTKRLKILKAHLEPRTQNLKPLLVLDLVQLEGKKPVTWRQFQEGHPDFSF